MQNRRRAFLTVCLALCVLLGMVYLRLSQDDYDRRTLGSIDYTDMATRAMFFEKGEYRFSFHYTYEPDAEVQIVRTMTADEANALPAVLASAPLNEGGYTEITLTLSEAVYDLQFRYTGETNPGVTSIESVGRVWHDSAAILLLIAATAAVFLWLSRRPSALNDTGFSEQTVRLVLLAASVVATLPVMRGFFVIGHDLAYHLMRIENIKDGLLGGQFPVRVGPTFWNGLGYASSILYPELFLYLPAVIRLCGASLMASYQIFVFLINLATFFTTYHVIRKLTGKATVGLIAGIMFGLGLARVMMLYLRGAAGEMLALVFFPCVMLGMYEILHEGKLSKWLIAGMTGLIQSHVVSVEIASIFCTIYTVIAVVLRKASGRNMLRLAAAAGITLLLNVWFLVPFLRFSREPFRMLVFQQYTGQHAVYLSQFFASYIKAFGDSSFLGTTVEMSLSVGLLPLVGIFLHLLKSDKPMEARLQGLGQLSLFFGLSALLVASTLFPWPYVAKIPLLGDLLSAIQYPWRFLGTASFFLAIVFAIGAYGIGKEHAKAAVILCLLMAVINIAPFYDQFYQSDEQRILMTDKTDMLGEEPYGVGDYAYADTDFNAIVDQPFVMTVTRGTEIQAFRKHGAGLSFRYASESDQIATIPLYFYPGYTAVLNGTQELEILDGDSHLIALSLPAGNGDVRVRYEGFWYFNAANFVSLASFLLLLVWWIFKPRLKLPKRAG